MPSVGAMRGPLSNTRCVHGGSQPEPTSGAMLTPIFKTTTYKQDSVDAYMTKGYSYTRCGNPTVSAWEARLAILEGAEQPACAFTTGMAAMNTLYASFLKSDDHVIVTKCSYGGTNRASRVLYEKQYNICFDFVDMTDLDAVRKAIIPGKTKMILSETPCNPTLQLADLAEISNIAKENSISNPPPLDENLVDGDGPSWECVNGRILHVCDTTMATPVVMRGLDYGCDILFVSTTKYYCGHNMNLGGALCTNDEGLYNMMRFKQNVMGSIINPLVAFDMLQTSKTLILRVQRQCANAMKIAKHLEGHDKVEFVMYPGLPSHPQHKVALKQHNEGMHGGMVSFEVRGGSAAGRKVMDACEHPWCLAENLGATESIMTCPSVFTHANMPKEMRENANITDGLIRLSVGIEEVEDLIEALEKSFKALEV